MKALERVERRLVNLPLPATVTETHLGGHLIAAVRITDEMVNTAGELAAKIQQFDSQAGYRESFAGRHIDWEMAGILGHLAAGEYLFGDWRKAVCNIEAGPDEPDFLFQDQTFDVKTAGGVRDRMLLVPVAKFQKRRHHVYIGAQLKGPREVWIWGYATRDDIASAPVKDFGQAPAHYIPLRSLHPICQLSVPADSSLLDYMTCIVSAENFPTLMKQNPRGITFSAERRNSRNRMSNDIQFSAKKGRRLAGVKGARLRGPRKAKRRVSLRVPPGVMGSVRRLAKHLDIPVTELCQLLIQFASIVNFLRLEKQEGVDAVLSHVRLSRGLKVLGGHEPRIVPDLGEPISLRFPNRFLETASLYAKLTGRTRSGLLIQFLRQGIRIYTRSWVAVTKALTSGRSSPNRSIIANTGNDGTR